MPFQGVTALVPLLVRERERCLNSKGKTCFNGLVCSGSFPVKNCLQGFKSSLVRIPHKCRRALIVCESIPLGHTIRQRSGERVYRAALKCLHLSDLAGA